MCMPIHIVYFFRYEDHAALYGGIDGLDVITQIFKLSKNLLQPKTG